MSLGYVLLEEGAEVDLQADMREVLSILDNEMPRFRLRKLWLPGMLSEWRVGGILAPAGQSDRQRPNIHHSVSA